MTLHTSLAASLCLARPATAPAWWAASSRAAAQGAWSLAGWRRSESADIAGVSKPFGPRLVWLGGVREKRRGVGVGGV